MPSTLRTILMIQTILSCHSYTFSLFEKRYKPTKRTSFAYSTSPSPTFENESCHHLSKLEKSYLPTSENEKTFATTPQVASSIKEETEINDNEKKKDPSMYTSSSNLTKKLPPIRVDDVELLLYDVLLLLNLSASISFWAVHRLSISHVGAAFNEGCLFSIFWIVSGLYYGSFLYSAVDGHQFQSIEEDNHDDNEEKREDSGSGGLFLWNKENNKGGPSGAGILGLSTFVGAANLRILFALGCAVWEHRRVGLGGEELIPLELSFGLVLMSLWRALHSSFVNRM